MKPFSVAWAELSQTSAWWVRGNSFSLHNDCGLKLICTGDHDQPFSFKILMKPFALVFQESLVFTYIFWVEVCIIGDHALFSYIYIRFQLFKRACSSLPVNSDGAGLSTESQEYIDVLHTTN